MMNMNARQWEIVRDLLNDAGVNFERSCLEQQLTNGCQYSHIKW